MNNTDKPDGNQYSKEFRVYMEYALQRYLCEKENFSVTDAVTEVLQNYEEIYRRAKEVKYI